MGWQVGVFRRQTKLEGWLTSLPATPLPTVALLSSSRRDRGRTSQPQAADRTRTHTYTHTHTCIYSKTRRLSFVSLYTRFDGSIGAGDEIMAKQTRGVNEHNHPLCSENGDGKRWRKRKRKRERKGDWKKRENWKKGLGIKRVRNGWQAGRKVKILEVRRD